MAVDRRCSRCGEVAGPEASFCPRDGAVLEAVVDRDPYVGAVVGGDIEITALAGTGAMGRVYRGHQRSIDRAVAVKILRRELSANPKIVRRFEQEARIASKVHHPHVVEVYLAGQLPDGALYIVMEFLDGRSLDEALAADGGRFPVARTLTIALQLCEAVGAGHAQGIVHRDLKPENIMLVERGDVRDWVKVLDFGIAKAALGDGTSDTVAGLVFGTPRYISPEGAHGGAVGPPGDVYSLATILYQLLAGRTPFEAEQAVGLLMKQLHEAPPPLGAVTAGRVPAAIAGVVMKNLAKDPKERARDGRALGDALAAAAREADVVFLHVDAGPRMSEVAPKPRVALLEPTLDDRAAPFTTPTIAAATAEAVEGDSGDRRDGAATAGASRRRWLAYTLISLVLAVIVAALGWELQSHRTKRDLDAHVARTRKAFAEGRFVAPPGDNVRDLVADGLARWPDDDALEHIRSDAAHELATLAMIARSAGDLTKARELVSMATQIDPLDATTKALAAQYADDAVDGGKTGLVVVLDVPAAAIRVGQRFELGAHVIGATPSTIVGARFAVIDTRSTTPSFVAATSPAPGSFRAVAAVAREGTYDISFEARAGDVPLRSVRSVRVTR